MPRRVAVTHADLAPSRACIDLGGRTGYTVIVLTILCGLFCFILCLVAEATRSRVTWLSTDGNDRKNNECAYISSGKVPFVCATTAFVILAMAMLVEHVFMSVTIKKMAPSASMLNLEPDFGFAKKLTWILFGIAEVLLFFGISVESGHFHHFSRPRTSCLVIREGLFSSAGIVALITLFLSAAIHTTLLFAIKGYQAQENMRREILEMYTYYQSPPPLSPQHSMSTLGRESPVTMNNQSQQLLPSNPNKHTSCTV